MVAAAYGTVLRRACLGSCCFLFCVDAHLGGSDLQAAFEWLLEWLLDCLSDCLRGSLVRPGHCLPQGGRGMECWFGARPVRCACAEIGEEVYGYACTAFN